MRPELIAGRYRVEREVGRGGMGSVWLCRDERLGRLVALKQVGGLPGESNLHLARALREARHSAALHHPNVVAIFDAIEEGDHVWLVMEYVESRTLDALMHEDGPLPPRVAAGIGADVADGLAAAHALGTVHRDVKPSNILVRSSDGRALIADFGIARTVGQEQLTRSGLVTGTPAYFAPELARGQEPSPASDVWALGMSLYVAVEGGSPYAEQANAIALLNEIAREPVPAPRNAGSLTTPMGHMLDPDPETRWSMARAAEALRDLAVEEPLPLSLPPAEDPAPIPALAERPPDTVPTRTAVPSPPEPPEPRRRRGLLALAALVVAALVGGAGWWLTREPADEPRADDPPASPQPSHKPSKKASKKPSHTAPAGPLTDASTDAASTVTTSSSPTSSGSATAGVEAGGPAELVADYYSLLPEDTSTAWELLTPQLQDEIGEGTFEGFWATIDDVTVQDSEEVGEGLVRVTITYTTDGRSEQETRQLAVQEVGDGYLISDDQGAV